MAGMVSCAAPAQDARAMSGLWPVDYLLGGYMLATGLLVAFCYRSVPHAGLLLGIRVLLLLLLAFSIRHPARMVVFRHWYPLPYVAACYKEMAILIPAIRKTDYDALLASLDYRLWGAHACVWMERLHHPWLTEFLQIIYSLFVPLVLLVAALLWVQRRYREFRYYAFLVAFGFLASYVGYFAVPVRGPRFFLAHLQHMELQGGWFFAFLQNLLDHLESAHYDCFPSGHTELILIAWWGSRGVSLRMFWVYTVLAAVIMFATIYLRYHYTIDVFAGAALAAVLLSTLPRVYRSALRPDRTEEEI